MHQHQTPSIQILIIDDDLYAQRLLRDLLEAQGHTVAVASAGSAGLAQARAQIPDLILLDVMMPEMDGFTVCAQLRAAPRTAEVPILMITALSDRASRLRGIEAGADEFLSKPIDSHEVRLRVQTIARVNRYRHLLAEREQAVAALTQARDAALEASRLKSTFLSTVSHELRTPLIGITGMSELLLNTALDAEQREFAQIIADSGQDLLALINDILLYTSLEAGAVALQEQPFDPAATLESAAQDLRPRAAARGLQISVALDEMPSRDLVGDPALLALVLSKLLDNAIKFTSAGQITLRATLAAESAAQALLRVQIRDSGIGVADSARPQIFEPFHQADSSTTRPYGGLGLGLAICRRAVDLLGGDLGVEPADGPGAAFWVQIPLRNASA